MTIVAGALLIKLRRRLAVRGVVGYGMIWYGSAGMVQWRGIEVRAHHIMTPPVQYPKASLAVCGVAILTTGITAVMMLASDGGSNMMLSEILGLLFYVIFLFQVRTCTFVKR